VKILTNLRRYLSERFAETSPRATAQNRRGQIERHGQRWARRVLRPTNAHSPIRPRAVSPIRRLAVSSASLGGELLLDCRDQKAVLSANHLRPKITDTAEGLSPVAHRERDFETNFVSVSLIRDIYQWRT
jgi:hypothetical protein